MKKTIFYLSFLLAVVSFRLRAQTSIASGNLMFVGFQSGQTGQTAPDRFAIILLEDVASGTEVHFTDNAVLNPSPLQLCTNEGTGIWTAGPDTPAGTVVILGSDSTASSGSFSGGISFSQSGDQILAFQPSAGGMDTVFISGFSSTGWLASCSAGCGNTSGNNSATCLPAGLQSGINTVQFSSELNNSFFNLNLISGSPEEIRSQIMNPDNWIRSDELQTWPEWTVNITAGKGVIQRFPSITWSPNPASRSIRLTSTVSCQASVFTSKGQLAAQFSIAEGSQTISIGELPPGCYTIHFDGLHQPMKLLVD